MADLRFGTRPAAASRRSTDDDRAEIEIAERASGKRYETKRSSCRRGRRGKRCSRALGIEPTARAAFGHF
jgi:hypothetical protein